MMENRLHPLVSVVIPTYQRCASVRRALEALADQSLPPEDYEAIVVVDGSTDGTAEMLGNLKFEFPTRVIMRSNGGRAAACNAGLGAARGDIVVLLDDDMEPDYEFLTQHRKLQLADLAIGVMGAVPIIMEERSPPIAHYLSSKFARHMEMLSRSDYRIGLRDFYSGNFSIRRTKLLEAGGFDEDFREYGNEDLELSVRLRNIGVRLLFSPTAAARQSYEKDFTALIDDNIAKGRTAVLLAEKHPHTLNELKLATFHDGPYLLRLLRNIALETGDQFPAVHEIIRKIVIKAEQKRLISCYHFYTLVLGYFYWTGVRSALAERHGRRAVVSSACRPKRL
jgi:GT2 family glycosyltransferase